LHKIGKITDKAQNLFSKGYYQEAYSTFFEISKLKTINNNEDLKLRLTSFSGMLQLALGEPDVLIDVSYYMIDNIQSGKLEEPDWFADTLYVSACGAIMGAEINNDLNLYTLASNFFSKLNNGLNLEKNEFDKHSVVLLIECFYKLGYLDSAKEGLSILYKTMSHREFEKAKEYLSSKKIDI
jgi:hypothetical protein